LLNKLQNKGNFRELIFSLSFFAEEILQSKAMEAKPFMLQSEVNGNSLPWKEAIVLLKHRGVDVGQELFGLFFSISLY